MHKPEIASFSFDGLEVETTVFGQMDTRRILVRMMLAAKVVDHFGEGPAMCVYKSVSTNFNSSSA